MLFSRNVFVCLGMLVSLLPCINVWAQVTETPDATISTVVSDVVLRKLKAAQPQFDYKVLNVASIPGFLEVQVKNGPLIYVSENGDYFFDGRLYRVKADKFIDTTAQRLNEQRRAVFVKRSLDDPIIFKPLTPTKAIMNVFTDVDCGYCRKFHREVPQLNAMGIEVRYFAFPRAGIPSDSYAKIATAWCAEDRQTTLSKIKNGDKVPIRVCEENVIADHYALGQRIGVTGTPAIVLMDGTLIPGYQSAKDFAKLLGLFDSGS